MNSKIINAFCFLLPFVGQVFNAQNLAGIYFSRTIIELIAYGSVGLLVLGIIINVKKCENLSKTAGLWIVFFILYYAFGILAVVVHDNPANILSSLIPVIYMLAFYVYLSTPENRKLFGYVALISLTASSVLGIYLFRINWSLLVGGIYQYNLDRSEGVFGDASSCALVSILAFIFIYEYFKPTKIIMKYLKVILLTILLYSLVITFSTTGYFAFVITFVLINHKYFTPKRMIFAIILFFLFYFTLLNLTDLISGLDLSTHQRDKVINIVNLLTLNTSEVDNSGRDHLLANLLNYVYESPIIGNGIDFTISIKGHNTFIGIWADAGIITFFMFLLLLSIYFKNAVKTIPNVRFFVLSILVCLIVFMASSQSVINQGYLMAIFVYIGYILDENISFKETKLNTSGTVLGFK